MGNEENLIDGVPIESALSPQEARDCIEVVQLCRSYLQKQTQVTTEARNLFISMFNDMIVDFKTYSYDVVKEPKEQVTKPKEQVKRKSISLEMLNKT